jgi:hypothetical protein
VTALGPPIIVDRPEPAGPSLGALFRHVPPTDPDTRWDLGVTFEPLCGTATRWAPCSGAHLTATDVAAPPIFRPFQVVAVYQCSTLGSPEDPGRYERNARAILERHQSNQVENELWTGTLALANSFETPFLTDGSATTITSGAVPLLTAYSRLVAGLRSCIGDVTGVVHVSPEVATELLRLAAIRYDNTANRFETVFGDLVIAGGGYPGGGNVTNTAYTLTSTASGGTFRLTVTDPQSGTAETTGTIAWNASATTVAGALAALSVVDPADIAVAGGPLPTAITVTFGGGNYAGQAITATVNNAATTGGTATLTLSTAGGTPAGDDESTWLYATGPMFTHAGPVTVEAQDLRSADWRTNTVTVLAERTVLYAYDTCCLIAAQANLETVDAANNVPAVIDGGGVETVDGGTP